ncbi:unnamed protein product [Schistosoma margrebowiei]|uniref:Uncharacterized protein n=1 Tax=Schistosoma margrebowiei TaxID=48269 RepID=A0AA85A2V3_9TREM|nr:unnamed protein product [Schistosoma margrebowiei]
MAKMHFVEVLKCWEDCKSLENYDSLPTVINTYIQSSNARINLTSADDVKSLNSLITAGFCDEYCAATQNVIIDLIIFFGNNIQTRYQLLTYFSILKPLIYGVISDSIICDKIKLLEALQLYTENLHNLDVPIEPILFSRALNYIIRIIHSNDDLLEPALGILANLSHFSNLVKQTLTKKEDFEALRSCLLRIISSDQVSRSALVFSVAVRFHLWNSADKFFEGLNAHRTLQVLFNVLLNGDVSVCGLCAGELLGDLSSAEPEFFTSILTSFPAHKTFIQEVVTQLRAKNTSLVLKLINLLRILLENCVNSGLDDYIRQLFFISNDNNHNEKQLLDSDLYQPNDSLLTLFTLAGGSDDLIGSAAMDLLNELIRIRDSKNPPSVTIPRDFLFVKTVEALRKIGDLSDSLTTTSDCYWDRLFISGHFFRIQLLIRHLKHLLHLFQVDSSSESTLNLTESDILSQIPILSNFLCQLVNNHLDNNQLVEILLNDQQEDRRVDCHSLITNKSDIDLCLLSCALSAESIGLLFQCTELLSSCAPITTQDDEVSLTQDTPIKSDHHLDTDLKFTQNIARQCGYLLQSLIERPEMPGLLALCLTASSPFYQSDDVLGVGLQTRKDVFQLLNVVHHVEKFDDDRFVFLFNQLINPFGYCGNKLLKFLSDEQYHQPHKNKTLFLNKWFRSLTNDTNRVKHINRSYDMKSCFSDSSETELLEKDIDKFLASQKLIDNNHTIDDDIKLTLSMYEYKIRLLQSREKVQEKNARINAEAALSAHKLCDYYRERLELAEYESGKLRMLQMESIANIHQYKKQISCGAEQLEKFNNEIAQLNEQLEVKRKSHEESELKVETLQNKLKAAREQIRSLDLTIDDYRNQLNQAQNQIQAQIAQINKFTQITRLINDLTGNPSAESGNSLIIANALDRPAQPDPIISQSVCDTGRVTSVSTRKTTSRNPRH